MLCGFNAVLTFMPARDSMLLSLYWPDWTGVVYSMASLNWERHTHPQNVQNHTRGHNLTSCINYQSLQYPRVLCTYQEEHPRLHDLSGQLHQSALLQEHLGEEVTSTGHSVFKHPSQSTLTDTMDVRPPVCIRIQRSLTLPGCTIS